MNKKMRMFQALLIVAILLLQMIIPIVPIYAKTSENIWKETFENGVDGWKFFDADGDGDTWGCFDERESIYDAFRGNYMLASKSINRTPDNYAVSPVIAINKESVRDYDKIKISWYAMPRSTVSCCENYSVSVYTDDGSDISIDKLKDLTTEYSYTFKEGRNYSIASFELKIADYEGKNIRLVFHHKNSSTNVYALQIDEISIDAFYSNASFIQRFGFEEGEERWSFIDTDGDGRNWRNSSSNVYEGQKAMYSYSKTSLEFNPKNYSISPIIDVSGKTNLQLEWYVAAGEREAYKEHYAVYIYPYNNEEDSSKVPTVEDISKLTPVFEETLDTYEYTKKTVDLNKYINYDKIRVIFYHYIPEGGSAQSSLRIDSISITGIGGTSHTANFFVDGTLFNSQLYNEGASILSPGFVPGKEGYTFVGWEPEVKVMGTEDIDFNAVFSESTAKLENIKIAKQPTKLEYTEGESFDKAGMEVKACYSDKTEAVITNYQITNGENLTKDQTSVTIKYTEGEKTVEVAQKITVKAEDPNTEKTIQFKDENLYNEIKSILGDKIKDYNNEELTIKAIKKDIEGVTQISPEKKVDDISGIGNFTGLKLLSLQENNLSDISEVEKLTNLTHLSISHTQVEDIKAVSKLTNLKLLNIEASKVTDISGLKDLVNLNELDLRQNNIENIDVVKNFKNLQILRFGENKVRDISAISELSNLEKLWIADNQISDANPIQKLPNLKYYGLENQQVTKYILKTQKEVELPPIFTQAKDKNSKIYTEKEYEFINCKLNEDGTKVILTTVGENATVKISGGKADGTTLNIIAVDEIPKELTSIEIAIHPGKFIYTEGEDFDTTGLKVEAKYSDGSSKELKEGEYEIVDGKNLKLGQETVTIRYTEGEKTVETTQKVGVTAKTPEEQKTLESIKITTAPTKTKYTEGEKFDKKGMKVTATYSDKTEKEVTDYTYTPEGELKTTDTAITVSYKEGEKTVEAKYTITVKAKPPVAQKTLESIKVTTATTRTTYTEGERFDKTGMKVIAKYSDGTTKEVTDYTYTPAGELKTTDKTITVSYTENEVTKTATQEITVVAKGNSGDEPGGETEKAKLDSIEIKEAPTKTVYTEGEKFDKTGMKVIAKYSDGTTKEIKNYAYTPAGALTKKDTTITVSYTENGVTKTDTQKIKIQNKDDGTGAKDKFPDTGAQIPIISGIVLMFAVAVASVVKIKRLTGI
jgi:chitodextrinase